jgi:hypothetical protein
MSQGAEVTGSENYVGTLDEGGRVGGREAIE